MSTLNFIEGQDRIGIGAITRGTSDRTLSYGMIDDHKRFLQPVETTCKTSRSTGSPTRVTATTRNGPQIEGPITLKLIKSNLTNTIIVSLCVCLSVCNLFFQIQPILSDHGH